MQVGARRGSRRVPRAVVGLLAVLAGVVAPALSASAHVNVVGSQPADGAVLPSAPSEWRLRFDERVDPALAEVALTAKGARPTPLVGITAGASSSELLVALPPIADGVYLLSYKVRDPIDLHLTAGSIVFGVGAVADLVPAGAKLGAPRPAEVVARALERVALGALIGAIVVAVLVAPAAGGLVLARRALGIARVGGLALIAAMAVFVALEIIDIGSPWGRTVRTVLTTSSIGRRALVLVVLGGGTMALAAMVRVALTADMLARWRRGRLDELAIGLLVLAVAACVATAVGGHAGTGGAFVVGAALRVVHLASMGAWAGGLAVALIARRSLPDEERRSTLVAFGRVGAPAFAALVITGLLLSGRGVASLSALLTTWYGGILLAKLAFVAAAAFVGLRHAGAAQRPATVAEHVADPMPDPLRRRGPRVEAALALVIVIAGGALSATPPANGPQFQPAPAPTPPPVAQQLDDLTVKLSMRPNRPGPNLVSALIVSTRRPPPGPIGGVHLTLTPSAGGTPIVLDAQAPAGGTFDFGTVELPSAGTFSATLVIDRTALAVPPATFALHVDPIPVPRARRVVSDAPLRRVTDLAAAVLLVGAAGWMLLAARRRRRHVDVSAPVG